MPAERKTLVFGDPVALSGPDEATAQRLQQLASSRPEGVSICLRDARGDERGQGYLFHFRADEDGSVTLCSYDGQDLLRLDGFEFLAKVVRHAAGIEYDTEAWQACEDISLKIAPGTGETVD